MADLLTLALPLSEDAARTIPRATLDDLSGGERFRSLDRTHSYFLGTQDADKRYDWQGRFLGYGQKAAIQPGWYVPFADRRPDATVPLAKQVVSRLTSMIMGDQNRPVIQVDGDEDTEAYVKAIAKASRLFPAMMEARDLGGACGAVAISYAIVHGKPRVSVHNAKHTRVLRWADRAEVIPDAVLEAYEYLEEEFDYDSNRMVEHAFWYVRYWDSTHEFRWQKIRSKAVQDDPIWFHSVLPDAGVEHGLECCPVVWVQNLPCSQQVDGFSDYEGQEVNLDMLNRQQSSSCQGTLRNTDPTLVVLSNKAPHTVKKGSENSIWAEGGAKYLTLPGDAMAAALEQKRELRQDVLDACQVVIPSVEKLSAQGLSGAAIRLLYAPMTSKCDVLRTQYGEMGIVRVLEGLLGACRILEDRGEMVILPPKKLSEEEEDGTATTLLEDQAPGEGENVSLIWPTYFPPTWAEISSAVDATQKVSGGKSLVSRRTAIQSIAQFFGIEDVDAELAAMDREADEALERQAAELALFNPANDPDDPKDPSDPEEKKDKGPPQPFPPKKG